ncbi:MAG TPA: FkbM family methyltransferase [Polyangiaceae bacterium]|nr:FkbM family methyltransferase [Polyangiaceae bacterium]
MALNFSGISSESRVGRVLRAPLAWLPEGMRVRVLQGPLRGKTWLVGAHTHGCWLGSYEWDKQLAFTRLVRPGSVVYDVGANAGFYTLLGAVSAGPSGRVVAFEPLPRNLSFLRAHVRLNALDNVTILDVAVAAAPGTARFASGATAAMGTLSTAGELEVRTSSLDALVQSAVIPPPDVIKMDIEGGELVALQGARGVLARHEPTLLLATHADAVHTECVALLGELGYECRSLEAHGSLQRAGELVATRRRTAPLGLTR